MINPSPVIKPAFAILACAYVTAVIAAPKSREAQIVGKWKCTGTTTHASMNAQQEAMAKSMMKSFVLEFKPTKLYTMTVMVPIQGRWSMKGDAVSMTMTSVMGMSMAQMKQRARDRTIAHPGAQNGVSEMSKPQIAILSKDGRTLTLRARGSDKGDLVFAKS